MSLFLKQSTLIDELALYDIKSIRGLAMELNCIDTNSKVNYSESGESSFNEVLENAKIVMITAGNSSYYTTTPPNDEILYENALIMAKFIPEIIKYCPDVSEIYFSKKKNIHFLFLVKLLFQRNVV